MDKAEPITVGQSLPKDAKTPTKFLPAGVDAKGLSVFFGFELKEGGRICLTATHAALGQIINSLQSIARIAQERRARANPIPEIRAAPLNPVHRIDIDPDIAGQFAVWQCTMQDGTSLDAQIPLNLMEGLLAHLPSRINEMKRRQAAHHKPN
jgi:hypothetical protein